MTASIKLKTLYSDAVTAVLICMPTINDIYARNFSYIETSLYEANNLIHIHMIHMAFMIKIKTKDKQDIILENQSIYISEIESHNFDVGLCWLLCCHDIIMGCQDMIFYCFKLLKWVIMFIL